MSEDIFAKISHLSARSRTKGDEVGLDVGEQTLTLVERFAEFFDVLTEDLDRPPFDFDIFEDLLAAVLVKLLGDVEFFLT